ncbi:MAG TPA: methyltransferase domain-containing protein [Vicinamibacteria bacterium]|nr:methyltransferase domain-containing protein [Vicinamibacteria bacterium]
MASPAADPSAAEEREYLFRLKGVFKDRAEHERYMADSWNRMRVVLELLEGLRPFGVKKVLELGANPYLLTLLLRKRFDFDLELANYFGEAMGPGTYTHVGELDGRRLEFPFTVFNVEADPFPYPDARFDCVLFCEILEHLLLGPDKAVAEMARVVKPGGFLIVTTPNITRLTNLYFLALGRNILDWYSPYGPYGRHNREYTLPEVQDLLARHGFEPFRHTVRNIQPLARRFTWTMKLRPDVWQEHLFVVGRKR